MRGEKSLRLISKTPPRPVSPIGMYARSGLKMLPCVGMKWKAKSPETNVGAGSRHCSTLSRDATTRRTKTAQCEGKEKFFGVWY